MGGVECRICGEACCESAISFRPILGGVARPSILPGACTGCGDCLAGCPVSAITLAGVAENIQAEEAQP